MFFKRGEEKVDYDDTHLHSKAYNWKVSLTSKGPSWVFLAT